MPVGGVIVIEGAGLGGILTCFRIRISGWWALPTKPLCPRHNDALSYAGLSSYNFWLNEAIAEAKRPINAGPTRLMLDPRNSRVVLPGNDGYTACCTQKYTRILLAKNYRPVGWYFCDARRVAEMVKASRTPKPLATGFHLPHHTVSLIKHKK